MFSSTLKFWFGFSIDFCVSPCWDCLRPYREPINTRFNYNWHEEPSDSQLESVLTNAIQSIKTHLNRNREEQHVPVTDKELMLAYKSLSNVERRVIKYRADARGLSTLITIKSLLTDYILEME